MTGCDTPNSCLPPSSGSTHFDRSCHLRNRHFSSTCAGSALYKNTSASHNSPGTGEGQCRRHTKAHPGNYEKDNAKVCTLWTNREVSVDAIDDWFNCLARPTHIRTWLNPEPRLFCHLWIRPRVVSTRPYHHGRELIPTIRTPWQLHHAAYQQVIEGGLNNS